jgi:hypothetical protein
MNSGDFIHLFKGESNKMKFSIVACCAGALFVAGGFAATIEPAKEYTSNPLWWKTLLETDKDKDWIDDNILRICGSPEMLQELERERAFRIWDSEVWKPRIAFDLVQQYWKWIPDAIKTNGFCMRKPIPSTPVNDVREWFYVARTQERIDLARRTVDLVKKDGGQVPESLVKEITTLEAELRVQEKTATPQGTRLFQKVAALRKKILLLHPALQFDSFLINRNPPTLYPHNCDQYLGRHSRVGDGPAIVTDWKSGNPKTKILLTDKMPPGAYQKPMLSYDATHFVFAFADHDKPAKKEYRRFFLYEAAVDGSSVRQLTGTASDKMETWENRETVMIEDGDPCYLPNGEIVFVSTRSQNFGRCHGGRYTPALMLYKCDKNGANIKQLSYGIENETTPSVLHDGRILFTRWEYVDRHEMQFHKLWWKRPDGSMISHFYGNDTIYPYMISEAKAIPDSLKVLANGMGHHNNHAGSIIRLDPTIGENGTNVVTRITPEILYGESYETGYKTYGQYNTPLPITENLFISTYSPVQVHKQGQNPPPSPYVISLVDDMGGREIIYMDFSAGAFSPQPIVSRKAPAILSDQLTEANKKTGYEKEPGIYMIQNVNLTRNDPDNKLADGQVKYLRFNQIYVKPITQRATISRDVPNGAPKRILGIVPVDPDGSVSVRVPSGVPLQIQALDENFMAVMTERSFHYLHPGERRGCVGCHEQPGTSLTPSQNLLTRAPRELIPVLDQADGEGISFPKHVQPVLDKHCIRCHGLDGGKATAKMNLIPDPTVRNNFSRPYEALLAYTRTIGLKAKSGGEQNSISRPMDYYALGGSFIEKYTKAHVEKKTPGLDIKQDEFQHFINWLDVNAQYGGTFYQNRTESFSFLRENEKKFREVVTARFGDKLGKEPLGALVNAPAPEKSRILMAPLPVAQGGWGQIANGYKDKDDPAFKEMTALVRAMFDYPAPHINGTCGYANGCACGQCWVRLAGLNKPGGAWLLKGDPSSVTNEVEKVVARNKPEGKKEKRGLRKEKRANP